MATIGEQFKAAREAKGISRADAATATKIMTKVITAMEEDDFASMAAPTYAKGFIKLYSKYLDLDPEPLLAEYTQTYGSAARPFLDSKSQLNRSTNIVTKSAANLQLPAWLKQLEKIPLGPFKDIRVFAGAIVGVLVLVMLIGIISTCVRNKEPSATEAAPETAQPQVAPPPMLLDEPLPDLYLTGPDKIETN